MSSFCGRCKKQGRLQGLILAFVLLAFLFARGPRFAAYAAAPVNPGDDLIEFLNYTIQWYQNVVSFSQGQVTSPEVLFRDTVTQTSRQALQLGFVYGNHEAQLLSATQQHHATGPSGTQVDRVAQAAAAAVQRVASIQAQLDQLDLDAQSVTAASRPVLSAHRDKLVAELNLAKARRQVLQDLVGFASEGTGGSLTQQIDKLQHAVPDADASDVAASTTRPSGGDTSASAVRIESMGILGLIGEMFSLTHKLSEIKDLANQTTSMQNAVTKRRDPIRAELMQAIHRGDALMAMHDTDDTKILADQRQEFDDLTARFKVVSGAAVPLSEMNTLMDATHGGLLQWSRTVGEQYDRTLRYLLIRLGGMGAAILVLLVISRIWQSATFRYVTDIRRRRQFLLVRRLVVGSIIILIMVAGFVTEFGSLATYAGLLTAGIAVALQSVILSGVAHFFFLGRYGVRVGDRVTISGITGDVIDIGIFRLYMMELGGKNGDFQATGRIVVFSNSVLFQPNAFYKQIPGADYNWHEVGLTLSPDSDYHLAETRLMSAIESVYSEYRETIERQHAHATDELHLQIAKPKAEGRLRLVDAGLEFVVRYPVEIRRASEIDDKMTRKLLDAIDKEPSLKLVATSTPKIQSATVPVAS